MAPLNLSHPDRPIHVGVILMAGCILDVAPVDYLNALISEFNEEVRDEIIPKKLKSQAVEMVFHWVTEKGPSVPSPLTGGANVVPTDFFETCPPLDIALMGAHSVTCTPNEAEIAFVRKTWEDCSAFITICGGVMVPLQAGILKGKTATGPRPFSDGLRMLGPETNWVEKRWVRDGKLWTSGALLNGLDLMYNLVRTYWGKSKGEGGRRVKEVMRT